MPVVYDPEHILEDEARTDGVTGEQFTQNAKVFCKEIEKAGYDAMIYSNMLWEAYELDLEGTEFGSAYDESGCSRSGEDNEDDLSCCFSCAESIWNSGKILDLYLREVCQSQEPREVDFEYFVPDQKKEGGSYQKKSGCIRRIDTYLNEIVLQSGDRIPLDEIVDIDGVIAAADEV